MIKNIIFGIGFLFFVNSLFNMNKANKLQKRIAEEKKISLELIQYLDSTKKVIDSLEIVLIKLENYDE
tara:strand:+ start:395 stop:598 length:204 start_codon:yes stop_codon:yes gene_type:complete